MTTNMRIGLGASAAESTHAAVREAVGPALRDARHPVIALVFATWQHPPDELASDLSNALGDVPWAGCSALGVFAGPELMSRGLVVALLDAPDARAHVGVGAGVAEHSREAGRSAVANALSSMPPTPDDRRRLLLLLPDTGGGSAAEVLRGALGEGGNGVVWAGGGAGDILGDRVFVQFADGRAHTDSVVAIAIDLPAPPGSGVQHGFRPFGPSAMVTRAAGDVAIELEYRSAFEVYREAASIDGTDLNIDDFGDYAMMRPLGIPQANDRYLVRDPVSVEDGGLRCVAEIPDGALVRVMRAEPADIVQAAGRAASKAARLVEGSASGALVFDCVSRHFILGDSFRDELRAICDAMGEGVPVFGCLTYGEVAAFGREVPQFHNKTTVVVALPS